MRPSGRVNIRSLPRRQLTTPCEDAPLERESVGERYAASRSIEAVLVSKCRLIKLKSFATLVRGMSRSGPQHPTHKELDFMDPRGLGSGLT
jgi:hypothetical protein